MLDNHEDDTPERHQATQRSTLVSVVVNLLLTMVQVTVGILAASQALVADGIHSLSDLVADFVVLLPRITAKKTPTKTITTAIIVTKMLPRWCWEACCWRWVWACYGRLP